MLTPFTNKHQEIIFFFSDRPSCNPASVPSHAHEGRKALNAGIAFLALLNINLIIFFFHSAVQKSVALKLSHQHVTESIKA